MIISALTTVDNPFDPFTQFDDWYAFDTQKGYNSAAFLDRIAKTSPEMSPTDYWEQIAIAIEKILRIDATGKHKMVQKEI